MDSERIIVVVAIYLCYTSVVANAQSSTFNIVANYGAKADGKTDIQTALMSAWKEACASTTPSTLVIPKGDFLLTQGKFEGPCKAPITVQVQGTVLAPAEPSAFKDDNWVIFNHLDHFTLNGGGTFDGQGAKAWANNDCNKNKKCVVFPINLRFNFLTNTTVQDITTKDSKQFNVNVIGCKNITFTRFTVSAPENSLNTDGIHLAKSDGVIVQDSVIKTGDDCISIGDGLKNVLIQGVKCGPGHGISIGSLGKYQGEEPVTGINVKKCTLTGTQNGVRIKTWPASFPGSVSDIHFEDITLDNVGNPIIVDQEYCPWNLCNLKVASKVKLSKITFKNIRGTSSTQNSVKLVCSGDAPCEGVELSDIDITYSGPEGPAISQCSHVNPIVSGKQNPKICGAPAPAAGEAAKA